MAICQETIVSDYETIIYEKKGRTVLITLNRPERLNAYDEVMHKELFDAWGRTNQDDSVFAIVIQGAGKAFCTGADMKEAAAEMGAGKLGPKRWQFNSDFLWMYNEISKRRIALTGLPNPRLGYPSKPIIAAIHGVCCGDGLAWLYSSDFAICSPEATFFDPHVNVAIAPPGLSPSPICSWDCTCGWTPRAPSSWAS